MLNRTLLLLVSICTLSAHAYCQTDTLLDSTPDTTTVQSLTLQECISYAAVHQPAVKQSYIDESIARTNNAIAFADWLPQVSGTANLQHYFQLPTAFIPINGIKQPIASGVFNTSTPSINASQTIFNTDVLLATRASRLNTLFARQGTANTKIAMVADVSKAFYDLLLTLQQINVLKEDTARLSKNQQDTYHQYVSGIVDKVDYKQASISLNNSVAQLKSASESINAKYATLKQLMGYPQTKEFTVVYDTAQMLQEAYFDTSEALNYEKRIEYQQLETVRRLARETTAYYQLGFIPSLSVFYNYNQQYANDKFADLYKEAYPYSLFGVNLSVPLFTGFKRLENIHKAHLQEVRDDWDVINVKLQIYSEYKQALAGYKSNYYSLVAQRENVKMAKEVYDIVHLQYREGIKTYLNVITAESDLINSEINYLNALFQLLSSKIDLEKAMGDITPNS